VKTGILGGLLSACVLISGCTTPSQVTTGYYDVKGKTAKALDRDLRRKGPLNGHALAAAAIKFTPVEATTRLDATGCRAGTFRLRVDAEITLPRWKERAGADQQLSSGFDNLARYAKAHEQFHVRIAELAAREMETRVRAIPAQKTCAAFEKKAIATIAEVRRSHDRAQKEFDAAEQKRLAAL
jgi:predicted secreted Zn-dependent protease